MNEWGLYQCHCEKVVTGIVNVELADLMCLFEEEILKLRPLGPREAFEGVKLRAK